MNRNASEHSRYQVYWNRHNKPNEPKLEGITSATNNKQQNSEQGFQSTSI